MALRLKVAFPVSVSILCGEGIEDQKAILVDSNEIARLQSRRVDQSDQGQEDCLNSMINKRQNYKYKKLHRLQLNKKPCIFQTDKILRHTCLVEVLMTAHLPFLLASKSMAAPSSSSSSSGSISSN